MIADSCRLKLGWEKFNQRLIDGPLTHVSCLGILTAPATRMAEADERNSVSMVSPKLRGLSCLANNLVSKSERRLQMRPSARSLNSKWGAKMNAILGGLLQETRWQSLGSLA